MTRPRCEPHWNLDCDGCAREKLVERVVELEEELYRLRATVGLSAPPRSRQLSAPGGKPSAGVKESRIDRIRGDYPDYHKR